MVVTIPACDEHLGNMSMTVEISDFCPVCGGKRGTPEHGFSYDGSRRLAVDVWENPCGHVDYYKNVRAEYRQTQTAPVTAANISNLH